MLRAEELRIGNWLYDKHENQHIKVYGITPYETELSIGYEKKDGKSIHYNELIKYLVPIVLTEEILLKIKGVCKNESKVFANKYLLHLKRSKFLIITDMGTPNFMIGIADIDFENKCKIEDLVNIWNWDFDNEMKLHQLQNLYFELTGKEIEIKL